MLLALVTRLATGVLTLFVVTLVVFSLMHALPGDPLSAADSDDRLHGPLDAAALAEVRAAYHLDEPLHRRYLLWLGDMARGDLGRSFGDRRPVVEKIGERIGTTFVLGLAAALVAALISLPLGVLAAIRRGSWLDATTGGVTYLFHALPVFWVGLMLQIFFSVRLDWLPLAGLRSTGWAALGPLERMWDLAAHLALPVLCLSYGGIAYLSRFVRGALLDGAAGESFRAARARGLSRSAVFFRHGLRQAGIPLLTLAGFLLPSLMAGSVIVETIFGIPGLGRLLVEAAFQRDAPVLLALVLLSGSATLVGILLADLAYAAVDPRVRRA